MRGAWVIRNGKTANYYLRMTGVGPLYGGTRKTATRFNTKREAELEIFGFGAIASVMANAVKLPPPKGKAPRPMQGFESTHGRAGPPAKYNPDRFLHAPGSPMASPARPRKKAR